MCIRDRCREEKEEEEALRAAAEAASKTFSFPPRLPTAAAVEERRRGRFIFFRKRARQKSEEWWWWWWWWKKRKKNSQSRVSLCHVSRARQKKKKENASEKPHSVRRDWNGIKGRSSKPNNFFRAWTRKMVLFGGYFALGYTALRSSSTLKSSSVRRILKSIERL